MDKISIEYEDLLSLEREIEEAEAANNKGFFFSFVKDRRTFDISVVAAKKLLSHLQVQYSCNPVHVTIDVSQFEYDNCWS